MDKNINKMYAMNGKINSTVTHNHNIYIISLENRATTTLLYTNNSCDCRGLDMTLTTASFRMHLTSGRIIFDHACGQITGT